MAIIIAHWLSTVRALDRILVFDRDRIVGQGYHGHLLARLGGIYRRLAGLDPAASSLSCPQAGASHASAGWPLRSHPPRSQESRQRQVQSARTPK
jgi:hypothetical protein